MRSLLLVAALLSAAVTLPAIANAQVNGGCPGGGACRMFRPSGSRRASRPLRRSSPALARHTEARPRDDGSQHAEAHGTALQLDPVHAQILSSAHHTDILATDLMVSGHLDDAAQTYRRAAQFYVAAGRNRDAARVYRMAKRIYVRLNYSGGVEDVDENLRSLSDEGAPVDLNAPSVHAALHAAGNLEGLGARLLTGGNLGLAAETFTRAAQLYAAAGRDADALRAYQSARQIYVSERSSGAIELLDASFREISGH